MKSKYPLRWLLGIIVVLILISVIHSQLNIEDVGQKYTVEEVVQEEEAIPEETEEVPVIEGTEEVEVMNEVIITIVNLKFVPDSIAISPGTTVIWVNDDTSPHKVVAYDRPFYGPRLQPGEKYKFTFTTEGKHRYFDGVFPKIGRGEIIVQEEPLPITGNVVGVSTGNKESRFALLVLLFMVMIFAVSHAIYKHY